MRPAINFSFIKLSNSRVKANDGFTLTGTISSYSYLANFC